MQTKLRSAVAAVIVGILSSVHGHALEGRTPRPLPRPRSDVRDAKLAATLAELMRAARSRDPELLRALFDARATTRPADHDAVDRRWRDAGSPLWGQLRRALELGGARCADGRFVLPWVAAVWPQDVPADAHAAVIVPRTELRAAPSHDARVRALVGYEVLRLAGAYEALPAGWVKVRTPGRIYGYVLAAHVWNPLDVRAVLRRKPDGSWGLDALSTAWPARPTTLPFTVPPPAVGAAKRQAR